MHYLKTLKKDSKLFDVGSTFVKTEIGGRSSTVIMRLS